MVATMHYACLTIKMFAQSIVPWPEVESQISERLPKEPVKSAGYLNGKLTAGKEEIKTNSCGQEVLNDLQFHAAAVCNQGKKPR